MILEKHIFDIIDGRVLIKSSIVTSALKDAKAHILNDGIAENHLMFDLLQKYYTMHLLQLWGHIEDVVSEEVGDIKATYSKTASAPGESKWYAVYKRERIKITGS